MQRKLHAPCEWGEKPEAESQGLTYPYPTSAAISTQALSRNLQAASGVSNGSEIADYGRTTATNPVPVTLSFSIGIIKVRQARRTENPIMWGLLKKSRTAQFTPWRAIPAIVAEKITMP